MKPFRNVKLSYVETLDEALDLKEWVGERRGHLGLDSETQGLALGADRLRLIQIGDVDQGWVIPVEGSRSWFGLAKEILESYDRPIALQNAIFDLSFFEEEGINIPFHLIDDTMVLSHLHQSGYATGLKPVSRREVDRMADIGQQALNDAEKKQGWDWASVPVDFPAYWMYSALDPVLTARVYDIQAPRVLPEFGWNYDIELGAIRALKDCQKRGMQVDVPLCRSESQRLEVEKSIYRPSIPCNPRSRQQLVDALLEAGLSEETELTKRTKHGAIAVDKDVLKSLVGDERVPWAQDALDWRKRDDMQDYMDTMLDLNIDGIVHPQIRVLGAEKTGRMSISAPALQTVPHTAEGRNPFIAREGHTLICADYAGMELRLMAHIAKEERMLGLFRSGVDLHGWLAEEVYGPGFAKAHRTVAKNSQFAKIYMAGVAKFALMTGLSFEESEAFLARYDELFPGVAKWQEATMHQAEANRLNSRWGFIRTWSGRRLMVPFDDVYKAVNYSIQGGCAEILKMKICELLAAGLGPYFMLPVHDELIFEAPDSLVPEVKQTIEEVMPVKGMFDVDFPIEVGTAKRWGDLYE